jgi:hypothetical protein
MSRSENPTVAISVSTYAPPISLYQVRRKEARPLFCFRKNAGMMVYVLPVALRKVLSNLIYHYNSGYAGRERKQESIFGSSKYGLTHHLPTNRGSRTELSAPLT